jgi:hemoglobin/transferrin/lactoferrin receptor protein
MMNSLRLHFYKPRKWFDEFRIITAWQQFNESRHDRKYRDPWIRHRKERVDAYSLNFDLEKSWENKQFLFYGLEYTLNNVQSTAYTVNIQTNETGTTRTRYPDEGSKINSFARLYRQICLRRILRQIQW